MGWFNKEEKAIANIIRCDESDYLIWKWRPAGAGLGESKRENAIRWGSSLRVRDGEVAVFVYKQKDGSNQDYVVGPFDETLKTANLPVLSGILGLAYAGGTPFQAEVYFINLARIIQVRFGVPYFDVFDPRFEDYAVPVAVRGTISFHIADCCEFVRLHRLTDFSLEDFQRQIRNAVCRYVKDTVTNAPAEHSIPVTKLESKISQINDVIEFDLKQRLEEDFGVVVSGVDIEAIEIDKSSDGYRQLMSVTKDWTSAVIRAEADAKVKDIAEKQEIEAEHYRESLRIQREESQYAQHKQTQTTNFAAFQAEKQAEVGIAGAEALGRMGENGAGQVNLGGGSGLDPIGIAAGMAVGGAVGQNIVKTLDSALNGADLSAQGGVTPPPIPETTYYVAANGQATGPFNLVTLEKMVTEGNLAADALVWKAGMAQWERMDRVNELKYILSTLHIPPIEG